MEKENWNEVQSSWVKFNKIGDYIIGTLIGVREIASSLPGQTGQMTKVYEIKADSGKMHDTDDKKQIIEEAIDLKQDEVWNVGGGSKEKPSILDNQFRNIKNGQKIKIEFTGEKPPKTKGFNPMKIKKVFTNGKFDEEWMGEQNDQLAREF